MWLRTERGTVGWQARTSTIMRLLRAIQKAAPTESYLRQVAVIACTEDIPFRAYKKWCDGLT